MEPITSEVIIRLLNENIQSEHAAIIQYQYHAFLSGEDGIKPELEEIAREEMRHLLWFAETVVRLGGDPTLERSAVFIGTNTGDRLKKNLNDERMAVEEYGRQREMIDDPRIKSLLGRVISDEQSHAEKLEKLFVKAEVQTPMVQEPSEEIKPTPPAQDNVVDLLNQDVIREYTAILQYLHQSFTMPVCEIGKEMLMIAQEEMKHLAWLAEEVVDRDGMPELERGPLNLDQSTQEMLQRDIQREKDAEAQYRSHSEAIPDPEVRRVLARIEGEEAYQREKLERFLMEAIGGEEKEVSLRTENTTGKLTVGSLFRQAME